MSTALERQENQTAYRRLRAVIDETYPVGHFVAIDGGSVVANDANFHRLLGDLRDAGKDLPNVLIVQAGVEFPETATIFCEHDVIHGCAL